MLPYIDDLSHQSRGGHQPLHLVIVHLEVHPPSLRAYQALLLQALLSNAQYNMLAGEIMLFDSILKVLVG